jgi:purine-binding chemotaxis protein CheW
VRVSEVTGLEAGRKIVPLPGSGRELLGLAGVKGLLVPIFSLAALLGVEGGALDAKWFVLCGQGPSIGLAFTALDGCVKVPRSSFGPAADAAAGGHVGAVVTVGSQARGVLAISSFLAAAAARTGRVDRSREG